MNRISKENYYLDIAETVLERATCLRRIYGAIIVKNDDSQKNAAPAFFQRGLVTLRHCSLCCNVYLVLLPAI